MQTLRQLPIQRLSEQRIGKLLAQIRIDKGIGQNEVAKMTGFSIPQISYIETGARITRVRDVMKIATALGYEIIFLPKKNPRI